MASRCSGPILNYPNHRKTAFFAAYYLSPFLFTLYFFKRILGPSPPHFISCCPVVGCHCRCLELSQTSSPLHQKKKGKPPQKNCIHSYIAVALPPATPSFPPKSNKQTIHSSILYPYSRKQTTTTNMYLVIILILITDCFLLLFSSSPRDPHHLLILSFFLLPSNCCFVSYCISALYYVYT